MIGNCCLKHIQDQFLHISNFSIKTVEEITDFLNQYNIDFISIKYDSTQDYITIKLKFEKDIIINEKCFLVHKYDMYESLHYFELYDEIDFYNLFSIIDNKEEM